MATGVRGKSGGDNCSSSRVFEMVRVHSLAAASLLSVVCALFCMMGHSRYGVKLKGGEVYVSLWTLHTSQNTYDLEFFQDKQMSKIPAGFLALNLEENSFQDKIIAARTFLLLDHYVNVVVFFISIIFLLNILTETMGALIVIGTNITHVVFLLIACSCMTSGYKELLMVDRLAWGNNIVWAGFAIALLSLVAALIGLVADKITLNRRSAADSDDINISSIPMQQHD